MTATSPIMLVDAAGLWFRAFYSVPERITGPHGRPVNAIRGFCDSLAVLLSEYHPSGIIVCEDWAWRPQWRVDLVPSYKLQRVDSDSDSGTEQIPETLEWQIGIIREIVDALGLCRAGAKDAEADDVIASLSSDADRQFCVVTGDRDLFQLAKPNTTVIYIGAGMAKREVYDPERVAGRFGLPARESAAHYADYAVLVGDASDGLPGVKGIGPKTAAALIARYGDLAGIMAAAHDPDGEGQAPVKLSPRQRAALKSAYKYLQSAEQAVRLGSRKFHVETTGMRSGAIGPADDSSIVETGKRHGVANSIARLKTAVRELQNRAD